MPNRLLRWFTYEHLPADLQSISAECATLAHKVDITIPENAEKTAGLRKLLEAKDCFVRAVIEARSGETVGHGASNIAKEAVRV